MPPPSARSQPPKGPALGTHVHTHRLSHEPANQEDVLDIAVGRASLMGSVILKVKGPPDWARDPPLSIAEVVYPVQ